MDRPVIPIVASPGGLKEGRGKLRLFCPALDGHAPDKAEYLALLPVQDSNGRLLAALAGLHEDDLDEACVGVLSVDPFRPPAPFLAALRRAGVRSVANFPTACLFDGETGETLGRLGFGLDREAAFLEHAVREGFSAIGFAMDAVVGRRLREAGAARIVVHPGPATGDVLRDAGAAEAASGAVAALKAQSGGEVFVHLPSGFGPHRGILAEHADAVVLFAGSHESP
ncbi:MAG TPA: phosphoenolpyruvate hydrolase family protein [Arenibaculum sp.]|nr:phosphoenolpyruvate hydrolase family protein [Arenibaculum sp.]